MKKIVLSGSLATLIVFILCLSSLSILDVKAQENTWTTLAPMPTPRAYFGTAVVNGKIYAIGGSGNVNEEYDPISDTWTQNNPMPTPRRSFAVAVFQNKIYCIGGKTSSGLTGANEVYVPLSDSWETKTPMPTARSQLSASMAKGKIYVIGGFVNSNAGEISDLNEVYDPLTDTWTTKASIPQGDYSHCSVTVDNKIYVISSGRNQIYNPEKDTWTIGDAPPKPVHRSGAIITSDKFAPKKIYVIGGEVGFMEATTSNQIYDPPTDTWSLGASMPTARQSLGVAVADDLIYAIGGSYPEFYVSNTNSIGLDNQYKLLTSARKNPVNFIPQEQCAVNEQYTPIGYGTPNPNYTPSSSTPTSQPSSTDTSQYSMQTTFPSTIETGVIVILVVVTLGLAVNLAKKRRS